MERGVHINFGIPTFKWSNEARGKAAVHCVIIGFSYMKTEPEVNQYLINAPTVFIESRQHPLCDVPEIVFGNMPNDGGNLFVSAQELCEFDEKYIRRFYGAEEFINNLPRYCLWLVNCYPNDLRKMPKVMSRIEAVRNLRAASKRDGTRRLAQTPMLFGEIRQPKNDYILIPRHSSENRRYIPLGFVSPDIIAGDSCMVIPDATLYHFGVLTSNVHMAWVRVVCGRLKSDYRYSKDIVYNNFPWPSPTDAQKAAIEQAAQGILDARAKFPDASLADLYDPRTMPPELLKAHRAIDKAVMTLYGGWKVWQSEADCVAALMERYQKLTLKS
jgi:hypothetical protein